MGAAGPCLPAQLPLAGVGCRQQQWLHVFVAVAAGLKIVFSQAGGSGCEKLCFQGEAGTSKGKEISHRSGSGWLN